MQTEKMKKRKKTFEEAVKAMTAKEIVGWLIEGIENPKIKLHFETFGSTFIKLQGECFACAATNAICAFFGVRFDASNIDSLSLRAAHVGCEEPFYHCFEVALDYLRTGNFKMYDLWAERGGFALMPLPRELPPLFNDDYLENLHHYKDYYNSL